MKDRAEKFLLSHKDKTSAKMHISSFDGGADIGNYESTLANRNSLLGTYYVNKYDESKSFLEIKVFKKTYKNGKGRGSLSGLGSFSHYGTKGNRGFVTFNEAKTSGTSKNLILSGGFYVTNKDTSNQQGVISHSKEVKESDGKVLDKTNFDKYFPKPYWHTKIGGFDKYGYNNGGFIDGAADLDKICDDNDSDCTVPADSSKSHLLKWEGYGDSGYGKTNCDNGPSNTGCDYIGSWSADRRGRNELQGYDHMYGKVGDLRLRDHLIPFYRGTWRQVIVKPKQ